MRITVGLMGVFVSAHVVFAWAQAIAVGRWARRRIEETRRDTEAMPVSIVVPAWQEHGTIERCIRSLQRLSYPEWEAVIIAGGPDGTYEVARRVTSGDDRFRVFEQEPRGKNAALTQGALAARYGVLVVLDADSEVATDWLSELVTPLRGGATVSFGNYFPRRVTWVSEAEQMEKIQAYHIQGSTSIQGSGSVAVQRDALARIGGFPVEVKVGVDWDLGIRLAKAGERVAFAERARVVTERPSTIGEFWANEVRWRRAHLNGVRRHRASLLCKPGRVLAVLYFYGLSTTVALSALGCIGAVLLQPTARPRVGLAAALVGFWLVGRRAALGAEIASYTGELQWLWKAWAPPILLFFSFPAAVAALLSHSKQTAYFKGPRPRRI